MAVRMNNKELTDNIAQFNQELGTLTLENTKAWGVDEKQALKEKFNNFFRNYGDEAGAAIQEMLHPKVSRTGYSGVSLNSHIALASTYADPEIMLRLIISGNSAADFSNPDKVS